MTMTTDAADPNRLNLEEAVARIRQLTADAARKEQEHRFGPWQISAAVLSAFAAATVAAGALIGAGVALATYLHR
jgi:hypothetical protein